MIRIEELKPNEKEREVLSLCYNRFYDLYEEVVKYTKTLRASLKFRTRVLSLNKIKR